MTVKPQSLTNLVALVGGCLVLSGPAILIYQFYRWLKDGEWFPVPLSTGLRWAGIIFDQGSWLGLQKIVDWILDTPLSAWSVAAGFGLMVSHTLIEVAMSKRLQDQ